PETMRVLTSLAETGAVTLALPQDVQAEAFEYPAEFFAKRAWKIPRPRGDSEAFRAAAARIRACRCPLIVAGGGVIYSEATDALSRFATQTGIAVVETQAGKGSLPYDHAQSLGAIGVTGAPGANIFAREADLVLGIGTRYSDFTTASKTAFENPNVHFVNVNVAEFDAYKHSGVPLVADARVALEQLRRALEGYSTDDDYRTRLNRLRTEWDQEVQRIYDLRHGPPISQGEVIGVINTFSQPKDVIVCAAGSLPGDLHKLWRTRDPKGYHLEYGYSTMGYEIAGGLGIKMADPEREVYVLVGDGSYLMMSQEIVTSLQEGYKLNIVVLDNHGFSSIGGLSRHCGSGGFGTEYRYRRNGKLEGEVIPIDFAANAASLGALSIRAKNREDLEKALKQARSTPRTTVICIEVDINQRVPGYESWWDVPVAEVSEMESVQKAHSDYAEKKKKERYYL
ncbi:MAG: thiamine pyrophosphate-dependent enzyme, partial [Candidatus Acidiferrales bacterium]